LITVSIIIPAYNEAKTIIELLERVHAQAIDGFQFEVIVVDDGSQDETRRLVESRPDLYGKLVALDRNGGKGAAVRAGLRAATGDYILFQDADLEYDPADYSKLLEPVARFSADIVMGSRMVASPITRVSYFWHKVGNNCLTLFFNLLHNTTFTDIYTCYLLYRRALVDAETLKTTGWEQQAEILSVAVANANTIYEVPVNYYGRTYAEGKKIRARHAMAIFYTILIGRASRLFETKR
jgi:glycosyltransferase involved in cell wall biosynthesis